MGRDGWIVNFLKRSILKMLMSSSTEHLFMTLKVSSQFNRELSSSDHVNGSFACAFAHVSRWVYLRANPLITVHHSVLFVCTLHHPQWCLDLTGSWFCILFDRLTVNLFCWPVPGLWMDWWEVQPETTPQEQYKFYWGSDDCHLLPVS